MNLILINSGMTLSILFFYLAYFIRLRNNFYHRIFGIVGLCFNLLTAVFLLVHKYLLNGVEGAGIFPVADMRIIHVHRVFAVISLVLMLLMAYTGIRKLREFHIRLHRIFLPLYTIVYLSGLLLFESRM